MHAYGTSKQANILFTAEVARRWPDVPAHCFHPGVVRTRFGHDSRLIAFGMRVMPFRSPERGADTLLWLTRQDPGHAGERRLLPGSPPPPSNPHAADPTLAARLWATSAQAVDLP